jgi:protein SCO1/2
MAGAYLVLVLGCFLAGFLLAPGPDVGQGPSASLERIKLPRPQPVGDFTLEDIDAKHGTGAYTRDRLLNQWTLMYFGYSHCPDVCRPTLEVLAEVARGLRAAPHRTTRLEVVFVTVDPARDTPGVLRAYLSRSGVDLVGLRGSEKQTAALARQLGLLHAPGDADETGDYLVDHPATILLIDPGASLRAGFPLPHDPGRIVEQVLEIEDEFAIGRTG